ncbi:CAP domain-containing protein [Micromonospora sp. KLBMP9576]|uniref:CAP domain-containing protein n=1 Tax=Micromonospora sp. KLBMP9576 TaxID=3424769 RepID=UPI003D8B74E2
MYGWTDPNDPDGTPRRPEQPSDPRPPTWPSRRPEPRSAYLFGDDPEQPAEGWHRDRPAASGDQWPTDSGRLGGEPHRAEPHRAADWPAGAWPGGEPTAPIDVTALRAAPTGTPRVTDDSRHRSRRRFSPPILIGGAAAAATLVVSLGVGAIALNGEDSRTEPTSAAPVAAAPVPPGVEPAPGDALAPPSASATPSATPSTARPTPSATKTTRPAPSRTSAPSRQSTQRSTAPAATATKNTVGSGVSSQAREVVRLVNAERTKAGCGAVGIDDKLTTAAQRHSKDQADHRNMSHTGSDGSNVGTRLGRVGYAWRTYGENVAWNQQTPAAVMQAWMNSPGHRKNILNCAFTEIGVGVANSNGPYWTQVFAAPR